MSAGTFTLHAAGESIFAVFFMTIAALPAWRKHLLSVFHCITIDDDDIVLQAKSTERRR